MLSFFTVKLPEDAKKIEILRNEEDDRLAIFRQLTYQICYKRIKTIFDQMGHRQANTSWQKR